VYKQLLKQAAHLAAHKANSAHSEEQGARSQGPGLPAGESPGQREIPRSIDRMPGLLACSQRPGKAAQATAFHEFNQF